MWHCITCSGQRGGILLSALIVTMLATMLVMAAAHEAGLRLETRQMLGEAALALAGAQAGLENAARLTAASAGWRATLTSATWLQNKSIGASAVTVTASDPGDGMVGIDGTAGSSSADTVRLTASAQLGGVNRVLAADYVPFPHAALRCAVYSETDIEMENVELEGRLRANGDVEDIGNTLLCGDITTLTGATVTPTLDDADSDLFFVSDSLTLPNVDFTWFRNAGQRITLPVTRVISYVTITASSNPYGLTSPRGIYWIDAGGGDVFLYRVAIQACLVVLNARDVVVGSWYWQPTYYYHHSPDPDHLPAMLVQGDLTMCIEYASFTTPGVLVPATVESGLQGVFLCTGEFWGPQVGATHAIRVTGAILADEVRLEGAGTHIVHDPAISTNPLTALTGAGLRLVSGTTVEL